MAIHLITGVPGAGKTAYTLWTVKQKADREGRVVFQNGIKDCSIEDWNTLENPEDWYKCPVGSIVVIDECQRAFRPRPRSHTPPVHIEQMETHRHEGIDLFLITQKPTLVDSAVKDLTGKHWHLFRQWGTDKPTVCEWESAKDITKGNIKDARQFKWKYVPEVFTWYKSTEIDTHKEHKPLRVKLMPLFFVLAVVFAGAAAWKIQSWTKKDSAIGATASAPAAPSVQTVPVLPSNNSNHKLTRAEYVDQMKPRIFGLPHTAPYYDEVTKPQQAPFPVACVSNEKKCLCYSQQGTKIPIQDEMCRDIVAHGYFNPFAPVAGQASSTAGALAPRSAEDAPAAALKG